MDQSSLPIPRTGAEFAWLALAAVVGYFVKHYLPLFKRRSPAEEKKTQAEARQIDVHSKIEEGTMMIELMKVSAQATLEVAQLRREKDFQYERAERLQKDLEIAEGARELAEQELDRHIRIGKPPT